MFDFDMVGHLMMAFFIILTSVGRDSQNCLPFRNNAA
jgi:hypothetical protein